MAEDLEIKAMSIISEALSDLDENARKRVIQWLVSREGFVQPKSTSLTLPQSVTPTGTVEGVDENSLSDYFYSVDPQNDMERALAVAAFLHTTKGKTDLGSQEINNELKHLGYASSNITLALTRAMEVKPQLMHQTRKEGTSQQARKKYKITSEGLRYLQAKISKSSE